MSSDKMRAEFEAWANSFFANAPTKYKRDALPKDDPNYGDYVSMPLQAAWQAWQASRAEPVVAPAVQGAPVGWVNSDELDNMLDDRTATLFPVRTGFHGKPVYATPQPAEQPDPHPDDAAVDRFAASMKDKLNKKRQEGRGGWQSMTAEQLSALLHEHVHKGDPLDVANLAMMLHQNGQRIEQRPAPDVARLVEALESAKNLIANHSGEVLPDEYAGDQIEQIDGALSAYREGGEE